MQAQQHPVVDGRANDEVARPGGIVRIHKRFKQADSSASFALDVAQPHTLAQEDPRWVSFRTSLVSAALAVTSSSHPSCPAPCVEAVTHHG